MEKSFTFGSYQLQGRFWNGTCERWQSLGINTLRLPNDAVRFSRIVMSVQTEGFDPSSFSNFSAVCSQESEVAQITAALSSGSSMVTNCGGYSWRVFTCSGNLVFCVNCRQNCVQTVACPGTSSILNPCATGCNYDLGAGVVVNFQYQPIPLYPSVSIFRVQAARQQINVFVNLSATGNVFCAALRPSYVLQSIEDVLSSSSRSVLWNATSGLVSITGLSPDTSYAVYCLTSNFRRNFMGLSDVIATRTAVSTLCCRSITAVTSPTIVPQYVPTSGRTEPLFQFSLDSTPTQETILFFSIFSSLCNGSIISSTTSVSAVPSNFRFLSNSSSLTATFVARGSVVGCYTVVASTIGQNYAQARVTFNLVNINIQPALPRLTTVLFSNDLTQLIAIFNAATDKGVSRFSSSSFNCSSILLFPGSNSAICSWINSTALGAKLNQASTSPVGPLVGDTAILRANIVKAACDSATSCASYSTIQRTSTAISNALNPLVPTAILVGPRSVAACSSLTLDPTGSIGSGYTAFSSVSWLVTGGPFPENNTRIQNWLNTQYSSVRTTASIPSRFLLTSTLEITLLLTNFAGKTAAATAIVNVRPISSDIVPSVKLQGTAAQAFRWQEYQVSSRITLPQGCGYGNSTGSIQYSWRLYEMFSYIPVVSSSANPSIFRISANTLTPGMNYTLTLDAVLSVPLRGTATGFGNIVFTTGISGVSAIIAGGSQRNVQFSSSFVVDGSQSYDLDYPSGGGSGLTYAWSCMVVTPNYGSDCSELPSIGNVSSFTVAASALTQTSYQLSLTVTNGLARSGTITQTITVSRDVIPSFTLSSPALYYNPSSSTVLSASLNTISSSAASTVNCSWSSSDMDLSSVASSPISRTLRAGISTFQLAIRPYRLVGGVSYTLTFSASFASATAPQGETVPAATATITITMNAPPFGGRLTVSPSTGYALTTTYTQVTSDWVDSPGDYPLYYAFSYLSASSGSAFVVQNKDIFTTTTSFLGQGINNAGYSVTCSVSAYDNFGGLANTSYSVIVRPPDVLGDAIITVSNSLNQSTIALDANAVTKLVSSVLPSINVVDCNTLPMRCDRLNRTACGTLSRTCGPCLSGYYGVEGPSNTPCISQPKGPGSACTSNSSCSSNRCVQGVCADALKTCPASCNNAGVCYFKDEFNTTLSTCTVLDSACKAVCRCRSGRFGRDCSLTGTRLNQNIALKSQFCSSLLKTLAYQDVSRDVVQARAAAVADILLDPEQITDEVTLYSCMSVLLTTVIQNPDVACEGSGFSQVSSAINNILRFQDRLGSSSSLVANVTQALLALGEGCQSSFAAGQTPTEVRTDNLRASSFLDVGSFLDDSVLDAASSSYEDSSVVATSPSLTLNVGSALDSTSIGVNILQYTNNPRGSLVNASSLIISTTSYNDDTTTRRRRLQATNTSIGLSITLLNRAQVLYKNFSRSEAVLRCDTIAPSSYEVNVTCPGNFFYLATCPALKRGAINFTCPLVIQRPVCTMWDGFAFVDAPQCTVTSFDAFETVCLCSSESFTFRRILQSTTGSSTTTTTTVELSTRFETFLSETFAVFEESPPFLRIYQEYAVWSTSSVFTGLFFLLAIVFFRAESEDDRMRKDKEQKLKVKSGKSSTLFGATIQSKGLFGEDGLTLPALEGDFVGSKYETANPAIAAPVEPTPVMADPSILSVGHKRRTVRRFFDHVIPEEMDKSSPWFVRYWRALLREHSIFRLLLVELTNQRSSLQDIRPSSSSETNTPFTVPVGSGANRLHVRVLYLTYAWCKILVVTMVTTVIIWTFYRDDIRCAKIENYDDCLNEHVFQSIGQACQWEPSNLSCQFRPPDITTALVVVLSAVVLVGALIIRLIVTQLLNFFTRVMRLQFVRKNSSQGDHQADSSFFSLFGRGNNRDQLYAMNDASALEMDDVLMMMSDTKDSRMGGSIQKKKRPPSSSASRKIQPFNSISHSYSHEDAKDNGFYRPSSAVGMYGYNQPFGQNTTTQLKRRIQLQQQMFTLLASGHALKDEDEFAASITTQAALLFHAARLEKQRNTMDLVLPNEEALVLVDSFVQQRRRQAFDKATDFRRAVHQLWYNRLWYQLSMTMSLPQLVEVIHQCRYRALMVRKYLDAPLRNFELVDEHERQALMQEVEVLRWLHQLRLEQPTHGVMVEDEDTDRLLQHLRDRRVQQRQETRLLRSFLVECFADQYHGWFVQHLLKKYVIHRDELGSSGSTLDVMDPYFSYGAALRHGIVLHQQQYLMHKEMAAPHTHDPHPLRNSHKNTFNAPRPMSAAQRSVDQHQEGEEPTENFVHQQFDLQEVDERKIAWHVTGLLAVIAVGMYVTCIVLGRDLGKMATSLWVAVMILSVAQEAVFLEMITVFIRVIFLPSLVRRPFLRLFYHLQQRVRLVLSRRQGHMRTANNLVQHCNAAARTARMLPSYPVSRFLFALADSDLPVRATAPPVLTIGVPLHFYWGFLRYYIGRTVYFVVMEVLVHAIYLPAWLQDAAWTLYTILVLHGLAWSFHLLATEASVEFAAIFAAVLIVLLLIMPARKLLVDYRRAKRRQLRMNNRIFATMDPLPQDLALLDSHLQDDAMLAKTKPGYSANPTHDDPQQQQQQLQYEQSLMGSESLQRLQQQQFQHLSSYPDNQDVASEVDSYFFVDADEEDEYHRRRDEQRHHRWRYSHGAVGSPKQQRYRKRKINVYTTQNNPQGIFTPEREVPVGRAPGPIIMTHDFRSSDPLAMMSQVVGDTDDHHDHDDEHGEGRSRLDEEKAGDDGVQGMHLGSEGSRDMSRSSMPPSLRPASAAAASALMANRVPLHALPANARPISAAAALSNHGQQADNTRGFNPHASTPALSYHRHLPENLAVRSMSAGATRGHSAMVPTVSGPPLAYSEDRMSGPPILGTAHYANGRGGRAATAGPSRSSPNVVADNFSENVDPDYLRYGFRFAMSNQLQTGDFDPHGQTMTLQELQVQALPAPRDLRQQSPVIDPDHPSLHGRRPHQRPASSPVRMSRGIAEGFDDDYSQNEISTVEGSVPNVEAIRARPVTGDMVLGRPAAGSPQQQQMISANQRLAMHGSAQQQHLTQRQLRRLRRTHQLQLPLQRMNVPQNNNSMPMPTPVVPSAHNVAGVSGALLYNSSLRTRMRRRHPNTQSRIPRHLTYGGPGRNHREQWEPEESLRFTTAASRQAHHQPQLVDDAQQDGNALAAHVINSNFQVRPGVASDSTTANAANGGSAQRPNPSESHQNPLEDQVLREDGRHGPGSVLAIDQRIQESLTAQKRSFPMFVAR